MFLTLGWSVPSRTADTLQGSHASVVTDNDCQQRGQYCLPLMLGFRVLLLLQGHGHKRQGARRPAQ